MYLKKLVNDFRLKILCLILFVSSHFLIGQNSNQYFIESYYALLSKDKDSAIAFCNQLINSSNYGKKAFGLAGKGHIYVSKADYENAYNLFNKSTSLLEDKKVVIDKEVKGNILYLEAEFYTIKLQFDKALLLLSSALDNCNGQCSFVLENKLQSTQGRIYSISKNRLKALEINRISLKKIKEQPNFSTSYELKKEYLKELAKASSRSMNMYIVDKEKYGNYLDSTKAYTLMSREFATKNNIHIYDSYIETYFAEIEFYQDKFDTAKRYYANALEIYLKKNNQKKMAQMQFQIAECDYYLNNFNDAEATFKRQIEENVWSHYPLLDNNALCYDYLAKIYKQKGDLVKAIEYGETYITSYEEFLAEKNSSDLNVNDKMHFEERKREVKELKDENERQKKQKRIYSYVSIFLIIAFLGLTIFFIYRNKKTRQNIGRLNERIEWLQQNISKEANVSSSSSLTDENALKLIEKLKALEKEELFIDPNYGLNLVAKKLNTNSSYLSKTVK